MTRRGFLGVAAVGAVGTTAAIRSPEAVQAAPSAQDQQRAVVLQIAAVVAVFPARFPAWEMRDWPTMRVMQTRLQAAERRLGSARVSLAGAGAGQLIAAGMLDKRPAELAHHIAGQAGTAGELPGLTGVTALAVASLSSRLSPNSDSVALAWLRCVRRLHARGIVMQPSQERVFQ
jgi:hypothetical protein